MLISVIVPAFNEEKQIDGTLDKIYTAFSENNVENGNWEIIVCDNNSTDRTAEVAFEKQAKVVFESINQISRARNTGAEAALGDWLLFIDADSFPSVELISEVISLIHSNSYIGCGATVTVEGGTLFNKLRMERLNPLFRFFNWCGGAFLLCETKAFRAIGGFSIELYAYEEIDFLIRLKRYGRKQGKKFIVLHQNPVITSGRKANYSLISLGVLFMSNFAAIVLFILHYILPKSMNIALGSRLLGYWYNNQYR
ncbi:glycosyltransferase [Aliifodinibius sp. S!AR15-10]|uniref:glycosyltransferase n=1 Tax=Aliifodinibius sp. S!AR15-10 TaxID=2950437 RepID=UPI002864889B|nr:glycosyltransferase [Aliifodinibius sp. S!AR15-10]MDR8394541.1 glycosyltransferase [Aliifodinibius sp. S!AR15-10]